MDVFLTISVSGQPKEIAALVLALQGRQTEPVEIKNGGEELARDVLSTMLGTDEGGDGHERHRSD